MSPMTAHRYEPAHAVRAVITLALLGSATCGASLPADLDPASALAGTSEQKVTASDGGPGQNFGYAVAVDGDTAAICAYVATVNGNMFQGAVYLFERIDGTWTETQKLTASDGAPFGQFGESLALEGDTLLVGSNGADGFRGAVYVFERSDTGWQETAKLVAGDGAGTDNFGWSVSIEGSTAVVGAPYADVGGNTDQGAAYVFTNTAGTWSEAQKLVSADGAAGDEFGRDVDVSGTTALIGAVRASVAGNAGQGAAYVFDADGGAWTETRKLVASDGDETDNFGQAVALSGTTALVGAPLAAAAYVFTDTAGNWTETQKLVASDGAELSGYFGYALDLDGDQAMVGALNAEIDGSQLQGAAWVFESTDGTWAEREKLFASDGAAFQNFGIGVGISGPHRLAGVYRAAVGSNPEQGAAYFYASGAGDAIFADGFDGG